MDTIDPWEVRFSQDSIKPRFRDGRPVEGLAIGLRSGDVDPANVRPIRLVEINDNLYSLDNRRLEAFRRRALTFRIEWLRMRSGGRV